MTDRSSLKIAIIGSKGIPALFGGIEKHVEEISRRLAARGHQVTVYGRAPFCGDGLHAGVRVRVLPTIPTKNLDAAVNSFLAGLDALRGSFDILHFHGIGPSLFCPPALRGGSKIVATVHALDYRQSKWGPLARRFLRLGERRAVNCADAAVAVSRLMAEQLSTRYRRRVRYIPNGATLGQPPTFDQDAWIGLEPGRYILSVGRFIVERGFHTLVEAFQAVDPPCKLVIVGDARFEERYHSRIRATAGDKVILPGYVHGAKLDALYAHCAFYVLPSLVEGLPISLIEAMAHSRPVLVSDIPENLEVAAGIGATFAAGSADDLAVALRRMLDLPPEELERMGTEGRSRVEREYDWDNVAESLERLYLELVDRNASDA